MMKISHNFDSGSIAIINTEDINNIQLELTTDNNDNTMQWFHFRCHTTAGVHHTIRILNAGDSSFSRAWENYQTMASYDQINWFRVPTQFINNELVINYTPTKDEISYAYFTPYDHARQQTFIKQVQQLEQCQHTILTSTLDNNSIDLLTIGEPAIDQTTMSKKAIWIIARQHPGETMAQWFIEGLVNNLLSQDDNSRRLLNKAVFYIVPNMNPDGSIHGNHRTNGHGLNLNREWHNPSKVLCPEVYYVRKKMAQTGVDLLLDIHGDEEIPYNFIMPAKGSCTTSAQANEFKSNFMAATKEFQKEIDYDNFHKKQSRCCGTTCGGKADTATKYVTNTFGCLALVLEMPFIDHNIQPNSITGWSAQRSINLGADILKPIYQFL
jgi:murein tripeptide amidase MpaA